MKFTCTLLLCFSFLVASEAMLHFGNIFSHINALGFDYTQIDHFDPHIRSTLYAKCLARGGEEAVNQIIRSKEAHAHGLRNTELVREVMQEALKAEFPMMVHQGAHRTACSMLVAFQKFASLLSGSLSFCLSEAENKQRFLFQGLGMLFYHSQCVVRETSKDYEDFVERGGRICLYTQARAVNTCLNTHFGKYEEKDPTSFLFFTANNSTHQEQCSDLNDFTHCTLDIVRNKCPNAFNLLKNLFKIVNDVFLCNVE